MEIDTYRQRALLAAALATTGMGVIIAPTRVWMLGGDLAQTRSVAVLVGWALFTGASVATLLALRSSYERAIRVYLVAIVGVIADFVLFETPNIAVICLLLGLVFVQQTAIAMDTLRASVPWTALTAGVYAPLLLTRMAIDPIALFADPVELTVATAGPLMALVCLGAIGTLTRRTLTDLNVALAHARDDALAASRAKSTFMATMSHELRTPLNAIIGYSELVAEEAEPDFEFGEDVARIHTAANQLLGLVDQVLDLSRIEAGDLDVALAPTAFATIVDEACDSVRPQLAAHRNELRCVDELTVGEGLTDGAMLRQVLVNLLSNAARFTEHGLVEVRLANEQRGAHRTVDIRIRDTGPGIPEDQLQRVLEPFTQVDGSRTRERDGSGMGLTIAARLCDRLGGTLLVDSTPGVGSTFTVCLPWRPVEALEATAPTS